MGRIKDFQHKNYLERNIHFNFSTVNISVAVLAYLVEFLNSILCVKKAVIVPREESIVYYIAKSLQVEFLGGLVVVVWFCCGCWFVG